MPFWAPHTHHILILKHSLYYCERLLTAEAVRQPIGFKAYQSRTKPFEPLPHKISSRSASTTRIHTLGAVDWHTMHQCLTILILRAEPAVFMYTGIGCTGQQWRHCVLIPKSTGHSLTQQMTGNQTWSQPRLTAHPLNSLRQGINSGIFYGWVASITVSAANNTEPDSCGGVALKYSLHMHWDLSDDAQSVIICSSTV